MMYLAKYALTDGIKEVTARPSFISSGVQYYTVDGYCNSVRLGRDIFITKEDAIKAAETARTKKIAALQKQLKRLENLTW